MDYSFSPEAKAFGETVRMWVVKTLPEDWERRYEPCSPEWIEFQWSWDQQLYRAGWGAIFWPAEFGGMDATPEQRVIFAKVLAEHNAPDGLGKLGKRLLAPVLFRYGTPSQRERFLPPMLHGEEFWAQGFSEPDAGSDLASLRTRGTVDGDTLVLDGQKVWTSHAWYCDWIFALVRTSTEDRPQQGISFVLVPTDYPGVTVRAIGQINGRSEFSEVFFDSARVPLSNVVGEIGNGWTIAKAVLEFERGAELAFGRSAYIRRAVGEVASDLASLPTRESGALARLARSQAEFIGAEVNSLRLLGDQMSGGDPGHMSAVVKLQQTGAWNAATVEHLKLLGSQSSESRADHFERYFTSRYATIAAGASEIQKDIIARRILNLPR